ncbi:hypothetical protein AVEN_100731-1 [Araneus ventricosus]|uniref:Uncharacterized protein n=1 Tax=Araneus ventricosus TaxID=182803 RepID=A0A4Y2CW94_ARAVE|nr:hypothetical protein AVEN_100731-1 [Araneus ventricosus]
MFPLRPHHLPHSTFITSKMSYPNVIQRQRRWDDGIIGSTIYEVKKKVGLRNHYWPRQLIQFITGHGPHPSYLFLFGKHPDNCCAVENLGRLFIMPPSVASGFLTTSGVQ